VVGLFHFMCSLSTIDHQALKEAKNKRNGCEYLLIMCIHPLEKLIFTHKTSKIAIQWSCIDNSNVFSCIACVSLVCVISIILECFCVSDNLLGLPD